MSELKSYIVMVVGAVFSLLAPIQNFMIAMALLFGVNFGFGLLAGCCKYTTMVVAWFVVFALAIGKELYDEKKYKGASESDWLADVIGLVRAELVILLLM